MYTLLLLLLLHSSKDTWLAGEASQLEVVHNIAACSPVAIHQIAARLQFGILLSRCKSALA